MHSSRFKRCLRTIWLTLLLSGALCPVRGQTDPGPVNTSDREAERAWFNTWWPLSYGAAMDYTGNVDQGIPGDISTAYRNQTLLRLNIYRRLMGEQPVTTGPAYNASDQFAALLCAANDNVSHNPPTTWKFYSEDGANACANSDLSGAAGPMGMTEFMIDPGMNNKSVGHRLTLTVPELETIGIGCSPGHPNTILAAGVLAVWANDASIGSTNLRYSDPFTLWPSKGYVPYYLFPGRWSVSLADLDTAGTLDLSKAVVEVSQNGRVLSNLSYKANNGGGAIVFTLDGTDEGGSGSQFLTVNGETISSIQIPSGDTNYHIKISNITIRSTGVLWSGSGIYEYDVIAYDPNVGAFDPAHQSNLINISTRSFAGSGSSTQIAGFILSGSAPRKVLIRAGGPYLGQFGVDNVLSDPVLSLYANSIQTATNDDWSADASNISAIDQKVGAPTFASGSKDAALLTMIDPGVSYTAQVSGKGSTTGNTIIEVYDADDGTASSLVNLSTRSYVGIGASIQIGGFVLRGSGPRKVLIRAGGPYLTKYNVGNVLPNPVLDVFRGQTQIVENDDWGTNAIDVSAACTAVGAPAYDNNSKDSAVVITVAPNVPYTAEVSGKMDGGTGNALIEIFALP